jgi:hypothetical protein
MGLTRIPSLATMASSLNRPGRLRTACYVLVSKASSGHWRLLPM